MAMKYDSETGSLLIVWEWLWYVADKFMNTKTEGSESGRSMKTLLVTRTAHYLLAAVVLILLLYG